MLSQFKLCCSNTSTLRKEITKNRVATVYINPLSVGTVFEYKKPEVIDIMPHEVKKIMVNVKLKKNKRTAQFESASYIFS